ncbi:hypothetical protein B0H11DRAFT_1743187 [Mycena galericulata]|nr:hypothetical protein B0H11DRAFT_1743187 [Mycena galericulata]
MTELLCTGITRPSIRRPARRGGVKRIAGFMYEKIRGYLKLYLYQTLKDSVLHAGNGYRSTVTSLYVVHALKRNGTTLYGYGV